VPVCRATEALYSSQSGGKTEMFLTVSWTQSQCYEGHPKSFRPWNVRQQYFPQSIHQWNVHFLWTL